MFRILNYLFGFILIYLFILEGMAVDHLRIFIGLVMAAVISGAAFILNRISLDALKAAILTGTFAFGLGGFQAAIALVLFFVTSTLLSDLPGKLAESKVQGAGDSNAPIAGGSRARGATNPGAPVEGDSGARSAGDPEAPVVGGPETPVAGDPEARRTGYQIMANGFWLMFYLIFWFTTGVQSFLIAGIASVAASNSDTWATELGQRKPGKTVDILTFREVTPGVDGGVSSKGLAAALAGSFLIGLSILAGPSQYAGAMIIIVGISGFAGCLADSVLGSLFKKREDKIRIPSDFSGTASQFINNLTNWSATGIAAIIALIITQIVIG